MEHGFGRHTAEESELHTACAFGCLALEDEDYCPTLYHNKVGMRGSVHYGYLSGSVLHRELTAIQAAYATAEAAFEIVHPWDSQNNESGHNAYTGKCPKDRDYAHAAGGDIRVMAAVGELCRGPEIYHSRVTTMLGVEAALRDQMNDHHGTKRRRKVRCCQDWR